MNTPLILLWSLVVIFAILFIIVFSLYINKLKTDVELVTEDAVNDCSIPPSAENIQFEPCCVVGNSITASRYSRELNMVVNPVAIPYLEVCQGYCVQGVTAEGKCFNGEGQNEYDNCIQISTPVNCNGIALPVAYVGITAYYPNSAGDALCTNTISC